MDLTALKARILDRVANLCPGSTPDYEFNRKYAGAKLDLGVLRSPPWTILRESPSPKGIWVERLFSVSGGESVEFRLCVSNVGYWRDVDIWLFDPAVDVDRVRTPATELPPDLENVITAEIDAMILDRAPADLEEELGNCTSNIVLTNYEAGVTERDARLLLWERNLISNRGDNLPLARRSVSGIARFGPLGDSGKLIAEAAFTAVSLGMRKEGAILLGHALRSTGENTPHYWNLLGCITHRYGLLADALECFSVAHEAEPGNETYRKNVWIVGKEAMPTLLRDGDFPAIVHAAQIMLNSGAGIDPEDRPRYLCALALGYEGRGDLEEASTYYSLARDEYAAGKEGEPSGEDHPEDDTSTAHGEKDQGPGFLPMATFGLHRLADEDLARRIEAFEAQLRTFPQTPSETGWRGRPRVTFVDDQPHGHHWSTVVEDMEVFFNTHFGRFIEKGSLEGEGWYEPAEISCRGFDRAVGFEFPPQGETAAQGLRVFAVCAAHPGSDSVEFVTGYPVFAKGAFAEMTMSRIYEYSNGLEANASMRLGTRRSVDFFVPDYYRDRPNLKGNFTYKVEIAGFAYWMEPFKEIRWDIDKGPMLEAEKEKLRSQGLPDDIASVPLIMGEDSAFFCSRMNRPDDTNHEFVGKVQDVFAFDFFGNRVHRVVVRFHAGQDDDLDIPIFVGEHNLRGFIPKIGDSVSGIFWLQGILREEVGPGADPEAGDDPLWGGLVDWSRELTGDDVPFWLLQRALCGANPEDLAEIPAQLGADPTHVMRVSGKNVFLHVLYAVVENREDLLGRMAALEEQAQPSDHARCIESAVVGIGKIPQGEGHKLLYEGFEELAGKFGGSSVAP